MKIEVNKTILIVFASILVLTSTMFAQDPAMQREIEARKDKSRQAQTAFDSAVNSSDKAKVLHERLVKSRSSSEFRQAILDVVHANDRSVVPYLKARLELYSEGKLNIEVALFFLGETEYYDKTIAELKCKDIVVQDNAIVKLSMFKTKDAYRTLYRLLDDETVRDTIDHGDYIIPSMAYRVKESLAKTVENPPKGKDVSDTATWKAWFANHKELIQ